MRRIAPQDGATITAASTNVSYSIGSCSGHSAFTVDAASRSNAGELPRGRAYLGSAVLVRLLVRALAVVAVDLVFVLADLARGTRSLREGGSSLLTAARMRASSSAAGSSLGS